MTAPANGNGTARIGAWASVIGTGLIVLGSLFWLNTQIVDQAHAVADLKARYEALDRRHAASDQAAQELTQRVVKLEEHQTEIETQLRATDQIRNLMHTSDLRIQSMLWEQAFKGKSHYPTDNAYYPSIAAPPHP